MQVQGKVGIFFQYSPYGSNFRKASLFLDVIPAKAEALFNSEAGQSILLLGIKAHGFPLSRE
jgi:hypothetical protein